MNYGFINTITKPSNNLKNFIQTNEHFILEVVIFLFRFKD